MSRKLYKELAQRLTVSATLSIGLVGAAQLRAVFRSPNFDFFIEGNLMLSHSRKTGNSTKVWTNDISGFI